MQTIAITSLVCFWFGAIIGSFLSVCIYRIPLGKYEPVREGIKELPTPVSIADPPRSFCPNCQHSLRWWHNIPLVSWLLLRGSCAYCHARIPFRYFFVELLTALLCVACYLRFGLNPTGVLAFVFVCTMIVITFIDIDYMIIPDVISYPGTAIAILVALVNQFLSSPSHPIFRFPFVPTAFDSAMGILAGAGVLMSIWWIYLKVRRREGLGLGDVKLLALIGATFGWECAWFTIFAGSIAGSIIGITLAVVSRSGLSNYLPFGPYLVLGVFLYLFDAQGLYRYFASDETPVTWWIVYQQFVQR